MTFSLLVLVVVSPALLAGEVEFESQEPQWGTIRGRVIVTGELPDVQYLARKGDPIPAARSIQDSLDGIPLRISGHFPQDIRDDSLLIDKKTGGLANVFVYILKRPALVHPGQDHQPETPIEIQWGNWRFEPRAVVARTGQHIQVSPSVPSQAIQVHVDALQNAGYNQIVGGTSRLPRFDEVFQRSEPIPMRVTNQFGVDLSCCHPMSHAYWLILDHPYSAVTLTDGSFVIPDLPVGEHELRIWHERLGFITKSHNVTVRANESMELAPLEVASERFVEKTN